MRICDKCGGVAFAMLTSSTDGQVIDLCMVHYEEFLTWLGDQPEQESQDQPEPESKPRRRGRPRKELQ